MDDLISRQAAIEGYCQADCGMSAKSCREGRCFETDFLESLPSAQRTGRWIWDDESYHCSECFFHASGNTLECMDGTYKYCPNCGCKMEVEHEAD